MKNLEVSETIRKMGHEIKTPLSVIVNDLTYLKSILPEGECERAIRNAQEIKDIINRYVEKSKLDGSS